MTDRHESFFPQTHHKLPLTMMFLRLLLILSSVVSIASQFKCTVLGCPKDNSLLGFVTLEDLQCAMQQEYDIVMSDTDTVSTGTGQPMYSYVLCPDTDFAGEPIVPLLNDTILSCASKEQGSCRIEAQVLLINNLNNVQFKDLTFSGGNFSISVLATSHAKQNSTALFQNCHWLNRTWAIDNVNLTSPEKMMHISLNDCTMTDSDTTDGSFTYGIRSYGGSITATNLTVSNYNVSRFMDIRDAASVTIREATFASSTIKDPDAFDDFIFVENDATLLLDTIDATDNRFANFVWAQSSAQVEVIRSQMYDNRGTFGALFRMTGSAASLTIRNCDLSGAGFSLVSVSGNGPTLTIEGSVFGTESRNNVRCWVNFLMWFTPSLTLFMFRSTLFGVLPIPLLQTLVFMGQPCFLPFSWPSRKSSSTMSSQTWRLKGATARGCL